MLGNLHELGVAMQFPWYRTWVLGAGIACAVVGYFLPTGIIMGRLRLAFSLGVVFVIISLVPAVHVFFQSSQSFSVTFFTLRVLLVPTILTWVAVLLTSGALKGIITGLGRANVPVASNPKQE
jgi:hypothetical protein